MCGVESFTQFMSHSVHMIKLLSFNCLVCFLFLPLQTVSLSMRSHLISSSYLNKKAIVTKRSFCSCGSYCDLIESTKRFLMRLIFPDTSAASMRRRSERCGCVVARSSCSPIKHEINRNDWWRQGIRQMVMRCRGQFVLLKSRFHSGRKRRRP